MSLMDLLSRTKTREEIELNRRRESRETLAYFRREEKLSTEKDTVARFLIRRLLK